MLRSIQSPPEDHDGRLRSLLNQRNALADTHGRFSTAMSESSDTPSVYSHSYFSPRPSEINAGYNPHHDLDLISEETRISYALEDYSRKNNISDEDTGDGDATIARMSYLGPKMRFHSRAPWEEDALQEEDEDFLVNLPFPSKNTIKNIASGFSSPRPSFASSVNRPSEDSSNSQLSTRRSFETVNSQSSLSNPRGGLYSLAQESASTNSLGQRTPKESLRSKFPSRLRNETPNMSPGRSFPSSSARSSSSDSYDFSISKLSNHPYANPDLVVSYAEEGPTDTTTRTRLNRAPPIGDSKFTMRESISVDTVAISSQSTLTPDTSMNSLGSKLRSSPINSKSISSPVSVIGSAQPFSGNSLERVPGVEHLPGWTERSSSTPFTLISLDEARRAQRMRTTTDTGVATISSLDTTTPFPGNNSDSASTSSPSSPHVASRSRGRSISAGAKAKSALQSIVGQPKLERRDSEPALGEGAIPPGLPPVKTLKNKKSGLMRLFNKEKDSQIPPPVPALPEGIHQSKVVQRMNPPSVQRVPVPPISPSYQTSSSSGSSWQTENSIGNNNLKHSPRSALSINTASAATARNTHPSRAVDRLTAPNRLDPDSHTHSAPPNLLEFPVLKLRPVSTLFSASFGDLVPENETTNSTRSRSSTTLPSSFTPASSTAAEEQSDLKIFPSKNAWNKQISDLEGQVRDLKAELEELKAKNNGDFCDKCGRGRTSQTQAPTSVAKRPRARTRSSSRFVNP